MRGLSRAESAYGGSGVNPVTAIRRHSALNRIADVKAAQASHGLESRPLGSIRCVAPGATNRAAQTETGWYATGRHLKRQLRARQQAASYARANKTPRNIPTKTPVSGVKTYYLDITSYKVSPNA